MFQELLSKIATALNNHQIPYMVIGGQAVLLADLEIRKGEIFVLPGFIVPGIIIIKGT